jgi:hypothetical protein
MAYLNISGLESGTTLEFYSQGGTVTLDTSTVRTGKYSANYSSNSWPNRSR